MYVCPKCEREYQSRSGLRRHMKSKHDVVGLPAIPVPIEPAGVSGEGIEAGGGPASERSADRPAVKRPLKAACKALGIDEDDVMAYKVYHEPLKVVIIEGPVGQKRVWCNGD